ncbi:hypothetical protein EIP91_005947 [Steccherinum ochraceum]|uniref:F-box domain-containing protein n=1 Tax=Steccherinum ochraceum TaxID=92696 RepID=A0A4R0RM86_9APHY|nr:hypothetical protein EIP91_005947 [Steccherinum ochraceum]
MLGFSSFGAPDLKLHDNEEKRAIFTAIGSDRANRLPEHLAVLRLPRFFHSLNGFHRGSLDLTGRHRPRYDSLLKRWNTFFKDIEAFPRQSALEFFRRKGPRVADWPDPYEGVSEDVIREFERKWRLPSRDKTLMVTILLATDQFLLLSQAKPDPVIQRLCLHHLPPELLHYILSLMDHTSARQLGATSRLFRHISVSYVYRHRSLVLKSPDYSKLPDAPEARKNAAMTEMNAMKQRLMDQMQFIIDDVHLLESIQTLYLGGQYQVDDLAEAGIVGDSNDRRRYYGVMVMALGIILSEAVNIHTLTIHNWDLSADLVPTILSLPNLHTVDLRFCRIWPANKRHTESRIRNAILAFDQLEDIFTWTFITGMPKLRVLTMMKGGQKGLPILPPLAFRSITNPFKTVEKLFVIRPPSEEITALTSWIFNAKTAYGRLRLTHLKVSADLFGLMEEQIMSLLDALDGAPMRCFSLDGIHYAPPDLLRVISRAFPRLESLSLQYRASLRQHRSKDPDWPGSTWEYAMALQDFSKLKHFIWNQCIGSMDEYFRFIKYTMDGWTTEETVTDDVEESTECHSIVKSFAAYGQSLELMTFLCNGRSLIQFGIRRNPSGSTQVATRYPKFSVDEVVATIKEHDPDVHTATWPRVYDDAADQDIVQ